MNLETTPRRGAFVTVLRNHAEIVLAHANRVSPKSAALPSRRLTFARLNSLVAFRSPYDPLGQWGNMGKREPSTILKTTSSRSLKNGRWVLTHLPAGSRPAVEPVKAQLRHGNGRQ